MAVGAYKLHFATKRRKSRFSLYLIVDVTKLYVMLLTRVSVF